MEKLAALLQTKRLDTSKLITHRFKGFRQAGRGALPHEGQAEGPHQACGGPVNIFAPYPKQTEGETPLRLPFVMPRPSPPQRTSLSDEIALPYPEPQGAESGQKSLSPLVLN